jgi:catechol 2,3-dioxygenase-like lactoylglutathione lyase family enzyme
MPERSAGLGELDRIVVAVPDPEATATFLAEGLDFEVVQHGASLLVLCAGGRGSGQGAVELVRGDAQQVGKVVLGVPDDVDLGELAGVVGGSRVSDTAVEVVDPASMITVSLESAATLVVPAPPPSTLRPRRMGHVNLKSPHPQASADFFADRLGLRLSEHIGDALFWLRTGTEHHAVALRPGGPRAVHHLGMEVAGWPSYPVVFDRLDSRGYKVEYGPGRHRPGWSLFAYVCDPSSGLRIELFAEMLHVPDPDAPAVAWEPGDRMTKTLNTWGPVPPQSFLD